jgi:hypothetical protein
MDKKGHITSMKIRTISRTEEDFSRKSSLDISKVIHITISKTSVIN